jgi:hypothetical protein
MTYVLSTIGFAGIVFSMQNTMTSSHAVSSFYTVVSKEILIKIIKGEVTCPKCSECHGAGRIWVNEHGHQIPPSDIDPCEHDSSECGWCDGVGFVIG